MKKEENKEAAKDTGKEAPQEKEVPEMTTEERLFSARELVKKRVMASVGAGLVPVPLFDMAALTGIQVEMLARLCKLYGTSFRQDVGKSLIGSLLGGVIPVWANPAIASFIKAIPLIGQTTGAVSMSIVGGASTYALGKVFIQHFESGGTFLDFDPEKVREYFAEQFQKGKKVASEAKAAK